MSISVETSSILVRGAKREGLVRFQGMEEHAVTNPLYGCVGSTLAHENGKTGSIPEWRKGELEIAP